MKTKKYREELNDKEAKMKGKKRIAVITLMAIMLITSMSIVSGCVNHLEDEVIIGDFVCQVMSDNTVHLKNLSEEGKKKRYIVVPQELNGMRVDMLGYRNAIFSTGKSNWQSENLEKVFIEAEEIDFKYGLFEECPNLKKIIIVNNKNRNQFLLSKLSQIVYFASNFYIEILGGDHSLPIDIHSGSVANISYYFNYKDSPNNGYYWIDDIEDGELIDYIPEDPKREGYKFEGWYKEEECKNKWNFAEDRVIKAQIHLEGVERFIENKLFAKWAKE